MMKIERLLVVIGLLLLGWYVVESGRTLIYQRKAAAELDRKVATRPEPPLVARVPVEPASTASAASEPASVDPEPEPGPGESIGRLEIPRIHLSVMVAEGEDEKTLTVAAGHLSDTPFPWAAGNSAIAGHRDTLFRPLRNVRPDDLVRVVTPRGDFEYHVTHTAIVMPSDVSVLLPTEQPALTLVTCYPFNYIGSAPKRFIVQATRTRSAGF